MPSRLTRLAALTLTSLFQAMVALACAVALVGAARSQGASGPTPTASEAASAATVASTAASRVEATPEAGPASNPAATTTPPVDPSPPPVALGRNDPNAPIVEAREAFRRRDVTRLAALRAAVVGANHPLASWVDYWELNSRLLAAQRDEVEAFYLRWRGRYVEDRLRNDWLLELGRRRDWTAFARDFPRFRMNDDREVTCYAVLTQHLAGKPIKDEAFGAWLEQRDVDDGCELLASTLYEARVFNADDVWAKVRHAVDHGRLKAARQAVDILAPAHGATLQEIGANPTRYLNTKAASGSRAANEFTAIALARVAATDPDLAAVALRGRWQLALSPAQLAWTWAQLGEQASQKHLPSAVDYYAQAFRVIDTHPKTPIELSDEALQWAARAALRSTEPGRWTMVQRALDAMKPATLREPTWQYWRARAQAETAKPGPDGDEARRAAKETLQAVAGDLHFYALLASEDLQQPLQLPARPEPPTPVERNAARGHAGLQSALTMIGIGLREEGVREWNFSLRGLGERELLAAAQWACEREVWDRCINTSDRTRVLVDLAQRYPMPFRRELVAKARGAGLDAAYVYGLIRQESRFITDARSHVGASGLMQVMPATARWTAKRIGLDYKPAMATDPDTNLTLGTQYLRLVLDDFGGSQPMAAAAYNAGPSRSRRWREAGTVEAAAWAESIPFNETRDYVKKVLANAVVYAALLDPTTSTTSLKHRLGAAIGPRETTAQPVNRDLP